MESYTANPIFEEKFQKLTKGKDKLAFHKAKNINRQLVILNQLVKQEGINKDDHLLLEEAVWVYHAGHYANYNNAFENISSLMDNWGGDSKKALSQLLESLAVKKQESTKEKILGDVVYSFWADEKLEKRLMEIKSDEKKNNVNSYLNDEAWIEGKAQELKDHTFATASAKKLLDAKKELNSGVVNGMIKKLNNDSEAYLLDGLGIDKKQLKKLKKKLAKVEGRPERGIETMFRLASKNLYTRARILDAKSSILITVNSIILSVVLGTLYRQMSEDPHLVFPVVILLITNLGSIGFAIISSRPVLKKGKFLRDDVRSKKASLLNFDDFHSVALEDYEWAMDRLMSDANYLYHTIVWDLHSMGRRMHYKYRNLKIAYNIFLYGLIVSIILFMACHIFFEGALQ